VLRTNFPFLLIAGICVTIGILLHLGAYEYFGFGGGEYAQRDIYRAINYLELTNVAYAGPEGINGGRLPGIFLYLLYAFPMFLYGDLSSLILFVIFFNITAILAATAGANRILDLRGVTVVASLFAVHILLISTSQRVLNPSFVILPSVLASLALIIGFINRSYLVILAAMISLLAMQLHLSAASTLVSSILGILLIIFEGSESRKNLMTSLRTKSGLISTISFFLLVVATMAPFYHHLITFQDAPITTKYLVTDSLLDNFSVSRIFRMLIGWELFSHIWDLSGQGESTNGLNERILYLKPISNQIFMTILNVFSYGYITFKAIKSLFTRRLAQASEHDRLCVILFFILVPPILYISIFNPILTGRYVYIFIFPAAVSIGLLIDAIFKRWQWAWLTWAVCGILVFNVIESTIVIDRVRTERDTSVAGSLNNTIKFHQKIMDEIGLQPKEYLTRVLFCNTLPSLIYNRNRLYIPYSSYEVSKDWTLQKFEKSFQPVEPSQPGIGYMMELVNSPYDSCAKILPYFKVANGLKIINERLVVFSEFQQDASAKVPLRIKIYEYAYEEGLVPYSNAGTPFYQPYYIRDMLRHSKTMSRNSQEIIYRKNNIEAFRKGASKTLSFDIIFLLRWSVPVRIKFSVSPKDTAFVVRSEAIRHYFYEMKHQIRGVTAHLQFGDKTIPLKVVDICGPESGDANLRSHRRSWRIPNPEAKFTGITFEFARFDTNGREVFHIPIHDDAISREHFSIELPIACG
jgi:hypothetical protein